MRRSVGLVLAVGLCILSPVLAAEKTSRQRGEEAVRGRPALNPPTWSNEAIEGAWKQWGLKEKPADAARAFRERYGLHEAPYDNDDLPMGLHAVRDRGKGVANDCLVCHAGRVAGQTIVGLGNASLDLQGLFEELTAANALPFGLPFRASSVRGTIDPIAPVIFLMEMRDAGLNLQAPIRLDRSGPLSSDPPAWWLLKKKKTRNWTGTIDARSARVDMVFLLHPLNSAEHVKKQETVYADIHAFVSSVEPPRYPFAVDRKRAAQGAEVFGDHCARCHGTYGPNASYPNKLVPLETIGTDPMLARSLTKKTLEHFNRSWLAEEKGPDGKPYRAGEAHGYQAPPLDGVWATAPYFHNGSAPTVYHVLNSKARPKVFTRSYRTEKEDYDLVKLGWKITVLEKPADPKLPGVELRRIYDTTRPGLSNTGHTFGDKLTEEERLAVIEYLKTL